MVKIVHKCVWPKNNLVYYFILTNMTMELKGKRVNQERVQGLWGWSEREKIKGAEKNLKSSNFTLFSCDVSDCEQILAVVKKIGRVDVLINNVGVWIEGKLQDNSAEKISEAIDVNFRTYALQV